MLGFKNKKMRVRSVCFIDKSIVYIDKSPLCAHTGTRRIRIRLDLKPYLRVRNAFCLKSIGLSRLTLRFWG